MFTTKAPEETKSRAKKTDAVSADGAKNALTSTSKATTPSTKTMLYVRCNTGFANTLFIRGQGANLSWTKGIPLKNIQADLWLFETDIPFSQAEFKVLFNDQVYEEGANRTVRCGSQIEFCPKFSR